MQSAIVAGASRFVGTYGGFSYLAPFCGVPATVYYSDAAGFSMRHLVMARSALTRTHGEALLDVRAVGDSERRPSPTEPNPESSSERNFERSSERNLEPNSKPRTTNRTMNTNLESGTWNVEHRSQGA